MKIEIKERLRPFCHLPGTECLILGSPFSVQVFPALLRIKDITTELTISEVYFDVQAPVKDFTIIQDLEKGHIVVFGQTPKGFMRYFISYIPNSNQIYLNLEKGIQIIKSFGPVVAKLTSDQIIYQIPNLERLTFGAHKLLDWELVKRRLDFSEILPVWHRLGQMVTYKKENVEEKSLLSELRNQIKGFEKNSLLSLFEALFQTGFHGIFVPQREDQLFQGFSESPIKGESPLALLADVSKLITQCVLSCSDNQIFLLPSLPAKFVHGRLCNINCKNLALIDLEWSKNKPRRMSIQTLESQSVKLHFPKGVSKARLRINYKDKGIVIKSGEELNLKKGTDLYLDRFEQ